jgi:DnaJ-class molecular chaperone
MELLDFKNRKDGTAGFILTITKKEALQLIVSLTNQMLHDNPNGERLESFITYTDGKKNTKEGMYFTVAVNEWLLNEKRKFDNSLNELLKKPKKSQVKLKENKCTECDGKGYTVLTEFPGHSTTDTCQKCHGSGIFITNPNTKNNGNY